MDDDLPHAKDPSDRIGGRATASKAIAVIGSSSRKGAWTISPKFTGFALFGKAAIDLTQAGFEAAETTIRATAIMGSVEIHVPKNVTVEVNGTGLFGSFDDRTQDRPQPQPTVPQVKVTGFALFGSVEVTHPDR